MCNIPVYRFRYELSIHHSEISILYAAAAAAAAVAAAAAAAAEYSYTDCCVVITEIRMVYR